MKIKAHPFAAPFFQRFCISCEKITVTRGFIIKRKTIIKRENVVAICAERGLISRIFSAVTVKFYTKAESGGKHAISVQIYKRDVDKVFGFLGVTQNGVTIKHKGTNIVSAALATSSAFWGFVFAVPFLRRAEKLFGIGIAEYLFQKIGEISEKGPFPVVSGAVSIWLSLFYVLSFLLRISKTVFSKTKITKNTIFYSRGFPLFKQTAVIKGKIGATLVRLPLLLRIFGRAQISVLCPAFTGRDAVFPNIKEKHIHSDFDIFEKRYAKRNTLYRFLRWRLIVFSLPFVAAAVLIAFFPHFSQFITFICFLGAFVSAYFLFLGAYSYKNAWIAQDGNKIIINSVSGFDVKRVVFYKDEISEIKIIRYPADIKNGTCTIKITAHQTGDNAKIKCIADNFAPFGKNSKKGETEC